VPNARSASFRLLQRSASANAIPFYCAKEAVRLPQSDAVEWEILQTPDPADRHELADNRVAIYLLHFHGHRMLFLNDASAVAVAQLCRNHEDLRCDVIIIGKHSLHPVPIDDLLDHTKAKAVIATHADFPESERIPVNWKELCAQRGATLFHQGETGMVSLLLQEDRSLQIRSFLPGPTIRLELR
jgi:competence protein ComEC